jgi:hypothetical protein
MQLASRLMALPSASPVGQQAATLEPQACWIGMATTRKMVSKEGEESKTSRLQWLTDGDAQAVEANEVLAAVAAGDLGAVAALLAVVGAGDLDLLVAVRGAGLGSGEGNSGHGGDEEGLEESHC